MTKIKQEQEQDANARHTRSQIIVRQIIRERANFGNQLCQLLITEELKISHFALKNLGYPAGYLEKHNENFN